MFSIGQVKQDSLDLKQPVKPEIRAVNNQSYSSILLLTQLQTELDDMKFFYQSWILHFRKILVKAESWWKIR